MNEIPLWILLASIAFLVVMSAFFSGSETSMMAINRYRLKHLVKEKNKSAKRVSKLLDKTDRLLGVILIGNNFTHTLSTALATVVAIRIWSDNAVLAVTVFMTIIMIIFAEVMPKTIAALKPESIAFPSSYLLKPFTIITIFTNFLKELLIKRKFKIKTICVGNLYIGGTGKTSLCIEINKILFKDSNFKSINHHFIYSGICKKCK